MKVLVGLSGGLDSTYAAYMLKRQGHEVTGAAVRMHRYTDTAAAEAAAAFLGIPFTVIDSRRKFENRVVRRFVADYCSGRTPNPCVECNPAVKLGALCGYAVKNGYDRVVTGHYGVIVKEGKRYFVRRSENERKDQSYVLWKLTQKQLSLLWLPLSGMDKEKIRAEARALCLPSAEAGESQDICFVPDGDYAAFVEKYCGYTFPEGQFIDREGRVLGKHRGIIHYTVGQRKGLGIALGQPMFVSRLNVTDHTVTLVPAGEEYDTSMTVGELHFMKLFPRRTGTLSCTVKVRYAAPPVPCTVTFNGKSAGVIFDDPVRAVTPGQSAVFYDGRDVLFGGIIDSGHTVGIG